MLYAITAIDDPAARDYLGRLYTSYGTMLCKVAADILADDTLAEDAVNNAMMSLFSLTDFLQSLDELSRVGYLRTVVRNAAFKLYNASRQKNITEIVNMDLIFTAPGPNEQQPERLVMRSEEFSQVRKAISQLSQPDRELLYLKYAARLTAREIARLTGASNESAVQMRISRARRKVLHILEEQGWDHE